MRAGLRMTVDGRLGCRMGTDRQHRHTVQLVDLATGWNRRYATRGHSHNRMKAACHHTTLRLPFPLVELHFSCRSKLCAARWQRQR